MRNSVIKKNRKVYIFKHQQTSSGGGGGGADLENNKTATIDVSTYTEPVEITPSEGKDGMKKATVTLDNIPSGGGAIAYAWDYHEAYSGDSGTSYFTFDTAPEDSAEFKSFKEIAFGYNEGEIVDTIYIYKTELPQSTAYIKNSSDTFYINGLNESPPYTTYTRNPSKDFDYTKYQFQ
jgi:hypothetical protein